MIKFLILVILLVLWPAQIAKADKWSYADKQAFVMECMAKTYTHPTVSQNYTEDEIRWTCNCVQLYFENTYTLDEFAQKLQNYNVQDGNEVRDVTIQCIKTMRQLGGPNTI